MRNKRVIIVFLCCFYVCIMAVVTYAAFTASGYRKGVAVANTYYFTSNILKGVSSGEDAVNNVFMTVDVGTSTNIAVNIRNYDSNMSPDDFAVTYELYYRLEGSPGSYYTYNVSYADNNELVTRSITSDTFAKLGVFTMQPGIIQQDTFNFSFARTEQFVDASQAASIAVYVKPISPNFMSKYSLGGMIRLSNDTAAFGAERYLDSKITSTEVISDMAAFKYYVSTFGSIEEDTAPSVRISWDASVLELDDMSEYKVDGIYSYTPASGSVHAEGSVTLELESGEYFPLTFFRNSEAWNDNITYNQLKDIVQLEVIE